MIKQLRCNKLAIAIIVMALFMGISYVVEVNRDRAAQEKARLYQREELEQTRCQAEYNVTIAKVIALRSRLIARELQNQNRLILSVGSLFDEPPSVQLNARYKRIFARFAIEAANIAVERQLNPLPPIPACVNIPKEFQ